MLQPRALLPTCHRPLHGCFCCLPQLFPWPLSPPYPVPALGFTFLSGCPSRCAVSSLRAGHLLPRPRALEVGTAQWRCGKTAPPSECACPTLAPSILGTGQRRPGHGLPPLLPSTPPHPPPPSHMALKTLNHPQGTPGLQTRAGRAEEQPREAHPRLPTARGRRGPALGQNCPPRPASYAAASRRSPLPGGLATQKEGLEEPQPSLLGWTRVCTQSTSWELSLTLRTAARGPEPRKTRICCSLREETRPPARSPEVLPPKHRLLEECENFF